MEERKGLIIGLSSKARCGKDTFAEYLVECFKEKHQRDFVTTAFATELKHMCQRHFGLIDAQLWGDKKEEWTEFKLIPKINLEGYSRCSVLEPLEEYWTPREIMQALGSFYRSINHDYWVQVLDKYIISEGLKDIIITDVRHINECEYVKSNGVLIKIIRDDSESIHGLDHESETALDNYDDAYFDITIHNDGDLGDLHNSAEEIVEVIVGVEKLIKGGKVYNGK